MLTIAETALELRLSVRQVRRLISAGELPVVHLTARRRGVLEADVVAYIAERRVVRRLSGSSAVAGAFPRFDQAERTYFASCRQAVQPPRRIRESHDAEG
jgi:hypothetical protein